jgi:hypothetical protein
MSYVRPSGLLTVPMRRATPTTAGGWRDLYARGSRGAPTGAAPPAPRIAADVRHRFYSLGNGATPGRIGPVSPRVTTAAPSALKAGEELRRLHALGNTTAVAPGAVGRPRAEVAQPSIAPWLKAATLAIGGVIVIGAIVDATRTKRQRHDALVRRIAVALDRKGWCVAADVRGFPKPPTVFGHRADVHAYHPDGRERLVEVEHQETLEKSHTLRQIAAFARYERLQRNREFLLETT